MILPEISATLLSNSVTGTIFVKWYSPKERQLTITDRQIAGIMILPRSFSGFI